MTDIFNYSRNGQADGQVASSEFAAISMGGRQSLMQSVSVDYGQTVERYSQLGDINLYYLPGRAEGTVSASKLVGPGGFLAGWRNRECGRINPLSVQLSGGRCGFSGSGSLVFDGGIIERVNITLNTQQLQMTESVTIRIASLQAN